MAVEADGLFIFNMALIGGGNPLGNSKSVLKQ